MAKKMELKKLGMKMDNFKLNQNTNMERKMVYVRVGMRMGKLG